MIRTTALRKAMLGLALAGTAWIADAATLTENYYTETPLALDAKWTLLGATGGATLSASHDGAYWDVTGLGALTDMYYGMPVWGVSISAFHDYIPHPGPDTTTGTPFSKTLVGTFPQTSFYSQTLLHDHPASAPDHLDSYTFTAVGSGAVGSEKVEIYLHAVHAVPEPETYAMMLAGLGIIGAIARRRRSRIG